MSAEDHGRSDGAYIRASKRSRSPLTKLMRLRSSVLPELAVTNAVLGVVSLATGVVLARFLTEGDRGILALAILWPTIGQSVFSLGIRLAAVYFLAGTTYDPRRVVANAFGGALVSSLLLIAVGTTCLFAFGVTPAYRTPLLIILLASPFTLLGVVANGVAQAAEDMRLWSRLRAAQPVTYMGLVLAFGLFGSLTAITASIAYVGSVVVQWALYYFLAVVRRGLSGWALERDVLVSFYRYGSWTTLQATLGTVNISLDMIILGFIVAAPEVGIYAIAAGMSLTMLPFADVMQPWILPKLVRTRPEDRGRQAIFAVSITALISGIGNTIGIIFAPVIVEKVVGARWLPAVPAFRILLVGSVFLSLRDVLRSIANGCGRPRMGAIADAVAALMTAAFVVPAIRIYGIEGAAGVSTIAYGMAVFVLVILLRREFRYARRIGAGLAEATAQHEDGTSERMAL